MVDGNENTEDGATFVVQSKAQAPLMGVSSSFI